MIPIGGKKEKHETIQLINRDESSTFSKPERDSHLAIFFATLPTRYEEAASSVFHGH